jgi:hypothetical protein
MRWYRGNGQPLRGGGAGNEQEQDEEKGSHGYKLSDVD